jgi:hypothetical protein
MNTFSCPCLLLTVVLAFAQQADKPPILIAIVAENKMVPAGSDVWINVSVTNASNQNLDDSGGFSDRTGLDPNLQFDVRDGSGKLVPKRTYPHPELETGKPVNRAIPPGETLSQEQRVSALYEMTHPGEYTVQVSRRLPEALGGGIIESNKITITVKP